MSDFLKSVIGIGRPAGTPATEADNATVCLAFPGIFRWSIRLAVPSGAA